MTDLRKAAEMALDALHNIDQSNNYDAIEALRQALAQPEQEPVAGMFEEKLPDQNPPPWMRHKTGGPDDTKWEAYIKAPSVSSNEDWISLYTAPPKREWVGYTNEDRERIVPVLVQSLLNHDEKTMAMLLKAILIDIELQLKEKNT